MGNMLFDFILHPAIEGDSHFSGRTVRPIPSVHGKPCLLA